LPYSGHSIITKKSSERGSAAADHARFPRRAPSGLMPHAGAGDVASLAGLVRRSWCRSSHLTG
jgi:hypothetical protein